jgi:murein DD-endopeptidase MepM/ murein hydrolase activator NlpD
MSFPLVVLGCLVAFANAGDVDSREEGQKDTALLLKADDAASGELFGRMSPDMKKVFTDAQGITTFSRGIAAQFGAEKAVIRERSFPADGLTSYLRVSRFEKSKEPLLTLWTFDAQGTILGLFVRPEGAGAAATKHDAYQTKTPLRFPLRGEWFTFWGGHNAIENYHVVDRGQRFAYDLLIQKDGKSHDGDGSKVEQFYAYGKPILAPAAGVVTAMESGQPDMAPGKMDPSHPMGNYIIINHGKGEYSFLCHLRPGSLKVKQGDKVSAGQQIAECGNSGNTSEPHLHYHLQNTGKFGGGDGLPAQFRNVLIDGKKTARGEPLRGQTVKSQQDDAHE